MTLDPVVTLLGCWGLALIFAAAALHKMRDWHGFQHVLRAYELLPPGMVLPVAICLWVAEVATAAGLIFLVREAVLGAAGLLALYALAMAVNLVRGRRLQDCGCGGGRARMLTSRLVWRNLVLVGLSVMMLIPPVERDLGWLDGFTAACALAAFAAIYGAINDLWERSPDREYAVSIEETA